MQSLMKYIHSRKYFEEPKLQEPNFPPIVPDIHIYRNSSSTYAVLARKRLNRWIRDWKYEDKKDILARLESTDANHHDAAIWELYLNSYFRTVGFHVIRDPLSIEGRTPDFFIQRYGTAFYVEATSSAKHSDEPHQKHWVSIVNAVSTIERNDFEISIQALKISSTPPKTKRMISEINKYLDGLSYETEIAKRGNSYSSKEIVVGDWVLEIGVIPKVERTYEGSFIRIRGNVDNFILKDLKNLKEKILDKRNRYGKLKFPYIVAILENSFLGGVDDWHRFGALFGKEAIRLSSTGETEAIRKPDGIWDYGKADPKIYGLILLGRLNPSLANWQTPDLWINPFVPTKTVNKVIPLSTLEFNQGHINRLPARYTWNGVSTRGFRASLSRWLTRHFWTLKAESP